ncbi:MAG: HD domain-containing protein [Proteobacteria bacterium]|nr:HD domain-containing protein [Pseudomonadota bacterium]
MSIYTLHITRGPLEGKAFPLTNLPMTIGRKLDKGLSINDHEASRKHCAISEKDKVYILEDLTSTNGTYLNGTRIKRAILKDGDCILIGGSELVFSVSEPKLYTITADMPQVSSRLGHLSLKLDNTSDPSEIIFHEPREIPYHPNLVELQPNFEDSLAKNNELYQKIQGHCDDFMLTEALQEAYSALIKLTGDHLGCVKRGAALSVLHNSSEIKPETIYNFNSQNYPCWLNVRALQDAINHKRPVYLEAERHDNPENLHRLILPVISSHHVISLIHYELDNSETIESLSQPLNHIFSLTCRLSPHINNFLLYQELDKWSLATINALMTAIQAKDTYTAGHSRRVCQYSLAIAEELNLDRRNKKLLMISALLHDVGKIGINDAILKSSSLLHHEEYEEMKSHPEIGDKIVAHLPYYTDIIGGIRHHHERFDGTGYPDGLSGDDIPFFARIVAIADAFDAMVSGRSYSGFIEIEAAVEKLTEENDAFHPEVIQALNQAFNQGFLTLRTGTIKKNMNSIMGTEIGEDKTDDDISHDQLNQLKKTS